MPEAKSKIRWSSAWSDARELIWAHRRRLILGAGLMIVNQAMGLVLPASTKYLIDVVIGKGRTDLLWKIALAAGAIFQSKSVRPLPITTSIKYFVEAGSTSPIA